MHPLSFSRTLASLSVSVLQSEYTEEKKKKKSDIFLKKINGKKTTQAGDSEKMPNVACNTSSFLKSNCK